MKKRFSVYLVIAVLALIAGIPTVRSTFGHDATPAAGSGVSRVVLVGANPPEYMAGVLELIRVDVAPGAALAAHSHPGIQIASIASGELTYTVVVGEVRIERVSVDNAAAVIEIMKDKGLYTGIMFVSSKG